MIGKLEECPASGIFIPFADFAYLLRAGSVRDYHYEMAFVQKGFYVVQYFRKQKSFSARAEVEQAFSAEPFNRKRAPQLRRRKLENGFFAVEQPMLRHVAVFAPEIARFYGNADVYELGKNVV